MAQISKTVRQALDDQQKRNLSRELSEAVRAADLADRRTGVGRKLAVRLARHVVALANVARHISLARETAAQGDWHAKVIVTEYEAQCEVRDRLLRKFLTGEYSDARLTKLGLEKWSRKVLAEEQARRKARPTAKRSVAKPRRSSRRKRAAVLTVKRLTSKSGDGSPQVVLTASSDSVDLDGERFSLGALKQMRDGLVGKTSWIGHQYDPSTDVFGSVTGGKLVQQAGRNLLDLTIEVARKSPRAMRVYDLIKSGIKLGASVGVVVLQTAKDKADADVTILDSVRPLEVSIVGLPANWDDAWVQGAKGKGTRAQLTAALT